MSPIPDIPLMGKNIIILSNKTFQVLIFEKIHITESNLIYFLENIWNHVEKLQDLCGQNLCKDVGLV